MVGYYRNAGAWLARRRESLGLTQSQVAGELGDVHSQFVSNWERGKCMPPKSCLKDLALVFKMKRSDKTELLSELMKDYEEQIRIKYEGLI